MHLLGVAGISTSPEGRYPKRPTRRAILATCYWIVAIGYFAWVVYVFATAPTFGTRHECTKQTNFVLFGKNIRATNGAFRWSMAAVFASALLALLIGSPYSVHKRWKYATIDSKGEAQRTVRFLGRLFGSGYCLAVLEVTIRRHRLEPGNSLWTFGQMIAMVTLVGPAIEFIAIILEQRGDRKRILRSPWRALTRGKTSFWPRPSREADISVERLQGLMMGYTRRLH